MILTEEEFKTKWCPEARVAVPMANDAAKADNKWFGVAAANRAAWSAAVSVFPHGDDRDNPASARCLGSKCGMWRWVMINQHGSGASVEMDGSLSWADVRAGKHVSEPPATARGYCGKAGAYPK